jgi:hypothetical protein
MMLHHTHAFNQIFKTEMLSLKECLLFFGLSLIPVTFIELWKIVAARNRPRAEQLPG